MLFDQLLSECVNANTGSIYFKDELFNMIISHAIDSKSNIGSCLVMRTYARLTFNVP